MNNSLSNNLRFSLAMQEANKQADMSHADMVALIKRDECKTQLVMPLDQYKAYEKNAYLGSTLASAIVENTRLVGIAHFDIATHDMFRDKTLPTVNSAEVLRVLDAYGVDAANVFYNGRMHGLGMQDALNEARHVFESQSPIPVATMDPLAAWLDGIGVIDL